MKALIAHLDTCVMRAAGSNDSKHFSCRQITGYNFIVGAFQGESNGKQILHRRSQGIAIVVEQSNLHLVNDQRLPQRSSLAPLEMRARNSIVRPRKYVPLRIVAGKSGIRIYSHPGRWRRLRMGWEDRHGWKLENVIR